MSDKNNCTISLSTSELDWEIVDKKLPNTPFKTKSALVQYLLEQYFTKNKLMNIRIIEIVMLMMMAAILLVLVVI